MYNINRKEVNKMYMLIWDKGKPYGFYSAKTKEQLVHKLKIIESIKGYKLQVSFHETKRRKTK